ncbi:uncharacterized protein BXZ73DRAFT_103873 [Epithele typhae]|uniref:uncharacterized protein n=1 Tax=Epithele typhae TaxID=378194 RepID=UPI002007550C|nr:uncharacterized protein BXZ73DRAFT_103873 [Epithele typhae]KAH9923435.1 hypothetical protein BXZ73DRAFT_103873 [Epithele typhae]
MAGVIKIIGIIVTGAELAVKIAEVANKLIPRPPTELMNRFRWIQCTVKNETQFALLVQESYFSSGRYFTPPGSTRAFDQLVFSGCNRDFSPTGVTGGTAFRLSLDDRNFLDIAIGWTNPVFGSYKAGVVESSRAKAGYDIATSRGNSITSRHIFEGTDKDGNAARFRIHVSAVPGQEKLYVIKQVPVA